MVGSSISYFHPYCTWGSDPNGLKPPARRSFLAISARVDGDIPMKLDDNSWMHEFDLTAILIVLNGCRNKGVFGFD